MTKDCSCSNETDHEAVAREVCQELEKEATAERERKTKQLIECLARDADEPEKVTAAVNDELARRGPLDIRRVPDVVSRVRRSLETTGALANIHPDEFREPPCAVQDVGEPIRSLGPIATNSQAVHAAGRLAWAVEIEKGLQLPQLMRGILDQWKAGNVVFCDGDVNSALNCLEQAPVDVDGAGVSNATDAHVLGNPPSGSLMAPWSLNAELPALIAKVHVQVTKLDERDARPVLIHGNLRELAQRIHLNLASRVSDYLTLKINQRYLNVHRLLRLLASDDVVEQYGGCDASPYQAIALLSQRALGTTVQPSEVLARATARFDQFKAIAEIVEDPCGGDWDLLRTSTRRLDTLDSDDVNPPQQSAPPPAAPAQIRQDRNGMLR
jgi:hypothetical protein